MTPIKELTTGSTFAGRYQVIEELGKGGMGRIYKVFDTKIKEKVALKLIRPDIASDPETIDRFSNEVRLARKIGHRNVCRMFDIGEAEGAHYITMEYVQGEDLKSMIRMSGSLSLGMLLSVGKQICDGLAEAHALGIVHRDLKPQNIMIDKNGNAKIMDFGIARSLAAKGITGAGVMIGTPEYMSPEQAEAKEIDARSDIYSLGIVLYEMATGRVPFEGETALSVAMKHKGEAPKSPKQLNPHIPDDLGGVILKCLEKDKSKRYQTAATLRDELDRIEKGIPTTERVVPERKTVTSGEITVKFTPKKLLIPALAVIAVVAAAIVFWPKHASNLDPNIVAVAVFENKTGDPKLDPIGSMAAERIMQGLTQVGSFTVAPQPAGGTLAAESKSKDKLLALAEATKAGKIVYGDYYLQGDTIQFHAWVQDMAAKKNIVSPEPVSGPVKDPAAALEPLRLRLMGGAGLRLRASVNQIP
jgi:serine/threonine protein kinase